MTTVVAGSDWFDTLNPDRQQLVRDTMADMTGFIDGVVTDFNQQRLDIIKKAKPEIGLVVLTDEERDAFRAQSTGTSAAYVEIVGDRGQELLDALQTEMSGN